MTNVTQFIICINNESNLASLILGKAYRTLPDKEAEQQGLLRVVDEDSTEPDGYLYPAAMFVPIEVPEPDVLCRTDALLTRLADQNAAINEAEVATDVAAAVAEARSKDGQS